MNHSIFYFFKNPKHPLYYIVFRVCSMYRNKLPDAVFIALFISFKILSVQRKRIKQNHRIYIRMHKKKIVSDLVGQSYLFKFQKFIRMMLIHQ